MIQEVFLESDWENPEQARATRDARAAQLQAQGLTCSCSTLYRATDGCRVFTLKAQTPETQGVEHKPTKLKLSTRRSRSKERSRSKARGDNPVNYR